MPRQIAPRQKLSYGWIRGEDFWGDPMSDNMVYTDAMLHPAPESMSQGIPPANPVDGVQFIVPPGAEYEWEGYENHLTMAIGGRWIFFRPFYGLRARVKDYTFVWFDGTKWVPEPAANAQPIETARNYDVAISVGYAAEPQETLLMLPIVEPMRLDMGATRSIATCVTPPPRPTNIEMYRNGTQIGTIVFSPFDFNATFLVPMEVSFGIGDRLRVITSSGFPDSFGDFGIVLRMALLN